VTNRHSYGAAHPDHNPIELKRGLVKEYVARKNASSHLQDALKMAEEKFSIISKEGIKVEAQQCLSVLSELLAAGSHY
jgi:hypothetical protein